MENTEEVIEIPDHFNFDSLQLFTVTLNRACPKQQAFAFASCFHNSQEGERWIGTVGLKWISLLKFRPSDGGIISASWLVHFSDDTEWYFNAVSGPNRNWATAQFSWYAAELSTPRRTI
jgi:hypothetical protein